MFIPLVNQAVLYNNMYITTAGMRYNLEDNYMSCFFFQSKYLLECWLIQK